MSMFHKNQKRLPPRVVLYGRQKIGKTSLAASLPDPVFIALENGVISSDIYTTDLITDYKQFIDATDELIKGGHKFKTVVVDSLDWLDALFTATVCRERGVTTLADLQWGRGYQELEARWRDAVERFDLLQKRGMVNFHVAHSQVKNVDLPGVAPYDRYELDLSKKGNSVVNEWADAVLFYDYEILLASSDDGKTKKAMGAGERVVRVTESASWVSGNRYGLQEDIYIEDGDNSKFWLELKKQIKEGTR